MVQQQHIETAIARGMPVPTANHEPTVLEALQEVVLRHQVCYEVWPEWSGSGGRARRIGYCVSLCGVNKEASCVRGHHVPGCVHCGVTYEALREIAEWLTLSEQPDSAFRIGPFDRALHIAPRQRWSRNEIIVNVKILHSHNVDGPVNDSLDRCLSNLRAELKKLRIHEGVWQGSNGGR